MKKDPRTPEEKLYADMAFVLADFAISVTTHQKVKANRWQDKLFTLAKRYADTRVRQSIKRDQIDREDLRQRLYRLDWIQLLDHAIKLRPSSWGSSPVLEWRNASDTVCAALIAALEDTGVLKTLKERMLGYTMHATTRPVVTIPEDREGWNCRFHPTEGWHEVGCPHQAWSKEELTEAIKHVEPKWRKERLRKLLATSH